MATADQRLKSLRWNILFTWLTAVLAAPASQAEELRVWRHGIVEAKSDAGFVFMASNGGFAKNEGLDLDMMQFKGDALALRAMLAGDLDSYEGNPGGPLIAASRGADIKIIGCYWPVLTNGIFVRDSVASIADLRALATIGVAATVIGMALYTGALDPRAIVSEFSQ